MSCGNNNSKKERNFSIDINAKNHNVRQYAERTAINAPMQGTAADVIKRAMIEVDNYLRSNAIDARMIMQVHDELVFTRKGTLNHVVHSRRHRRRWQLCFLPRSGSVLLFQRRIE